MQRNVLVVIRAAEFPGKMGGARTVPGRSSGHWGVPASDVDSVISFRLGRSPRKISDAESLPGLTFNFTVRRPAFLFLGNACNSCLSVFYMWRSWPRCTQPIMVEGLPLPLGRQSISTPLWSPFLSLQHHCKETLATFSSLSVIFSASLRPPPLH